MTYTVGVVGARGYTGAELLAILGRHPQAEVSFAGSRQAVGEPVPGTDLVFENVGAEDLPDRQVDVVFLAMPDGVSDEYVEAIGRDSVIVDISADHRFDPDWVYGLPELHRDKLGGAQRIANPGCYATALQLAVAPLLDRVDGVPAIFGVSGYSGAGTTPGPRNDPEALADNLMPYKLVGHNHERESSRHLGHPVRFFPHVHQAFRGILITAHIPVSGQVSSTGQLRDIFEQAYGTEPLIDLQDEPPQLADGTGRPGVLIGGFETSEDGTSVVVVAAEDNLLKGAAVQAVQNMNLALGLEELAGIM